MDFTGTDMDTDNNTAVDTLIVIMISFCLIRVLVCLLLSIFINRDMHCCVAQKCMMRIIILRIKHYMLIVLYLW